MGIVRVMKQGFEKTTEPALEPSHNNTMSAKMLAIRRSTTVITPFGRKRVRSWPLMFSPRLVGEDGRASRLSSSGIKDILRPLPLTGEHSVEEQGEYKSSVCSEEPLRDLFTSPSKRILRRGASRRRGL